MGCQEGRSAATWVDYSLFGHQIVCHEVKGYNAASIHNAVDGDPVPVPHFGLALTTEQFHSLADRIKKAGLDFVLEPHLRFEGDHVSHHLKHEAICSLVLSVSPCTTWHMLLPGAAGKPGEQWTMFFKDPSGNALEFKAMTRPENLFAKYYVE